MLYYYFVFKVASSVHLYHLAKISELLDTVFFVLRKKSSQITILHLYHHSMMGIYTWIVTKFVPGGQVTITMALNSFVHIIMYAYYMAAAFGPSVQKYLWWKKYITSLQLVRKRTWIMTFAWLLMLWNQFTKISFTNSIIFFSFNSCYLSSIQVKSFSTIADIPEQCWSWWFLIVYCFTLCFRISMTKLTTRIKNRWKMTT